MHGNVCEWCRDWYDKPLPGGIDPEVTEKVFRVFRGGDWSDDGKSCRSALRNYSLPGFRSGGIGFRVAAVQVSK